MIWQHVVHFGWADLVEHHDRIGAAKGFGKLAGVT
jgi:hypothetical protein